MPIHNPPNVDLTDDGTYLSLVNGSTVILKFRKSDSQILLDSGVDTNAY